MRESKLVTFLTFVVIMFSHFTFAAPALEPIKSDSQVSKEKLNEVSDPQLMGVVPGQVPKSHMRATISSLIGDFGQETDTESQTAYGISYANDVDDLKSQEWQAHWTTEKLYWIQFSERKKLFMDTLFDPYYKYGLSFVADPEDGLSSFTRLDSYFASGSVGILDIGEWNQSLTFEMGLSMNVRGLVFHAQLGAQYSF